jgi:hypothetical protein
LITFAGKTEPYTLLESVIKPSIKQAEGPCSPLREAYRPAAVSSIAPPGELHIQPIVPSDASIVPAAIDDDGKSMAGAVSFMRAHWLALWDPCGSPK